MTVREFIKPTLNLSLRSLVHLFISGSLFYFFATHFHVGLGLATVAVFLFAVVNEIIEARTKVENSFHSSYVFQRDRLLAVLAILFTAIIIKLKLAFVALPAPISLIVLTSFMDSRLIREKAEKRNLIKPFADIAALTLGPVFCTVIVHFNHF